jgi:hypothetical protein
MTINKKYNLERLNKYCYENSITLIETYSNSNLTKNIIIKGNCIYENCKYNFEKKFENLIGSGAYCSNCIKIISVEKMKNTFLKKYGSENILQLDFIKDKTNPNKFTYDKLINYCKENNIILVNDHSNIKLTKKSIINAKCQTQHCNLHVEKVFREIEKTGVYCKLCAEQIKQIKKKNTCLEKFGVEHHRNAEQVKEKTKQTCLEKYGVEYSFQSEQVKDKIKETCIERYGVKNASQNEYIREKYKNTCLEKYGVEHFSQSDNYKQKYKTTIFKKYGVQFISQNEDVKRKRIETSLKRYGVEYPIQNEDVKRKRIETSLKRYGVEYPIQHPEVLDKNIKSCFRTKQYIFSSGRIEHIQGYEHFALDELINNEYINENDIIIGAKNVPSIWYFDNNGKNHRHFVDIFIPTQNRCIEVKSIWTAEKNKHNIYLKQQAAKDLGYKYEIWVYNEKKEKINCYD